MKSRPPAYKNRLLYKSPDGSDLKPEVHQKQMRSSHLRKGDLLIAIVGATIGKVGIYDYDVAANINQAVAAIRMRNLAPLYAQIFYLTSFGQLLIDRMKRPVARANINLEEVGALQIVISDEQVQQKTIKLFEQAIQNKQQKEQQSRELLSTIDDYLLNALGIMLPPMTTEKISPIIFQTNWQQVASGRLDPNYVQKAHLLKSHLNDKYPFVPLKSLLLSPPQYGANEEAVKVENVDSTRYIRITDLDELGNLKPNTFVTAAKTEDKYLLQVGDLLFARSGSVGRVYLHKSLPYDAIFAGYLIRFSVDSSRILPDFVFHFCHSSIYKIWVDAISRSAVQSNINAEEYKSLSIPLLPIEKQQEIVTTISAIRRQAQQLQQEAQEGFDAAKREIENLILA